MMAEGCSLPSITSNVKSTRIKQIFKTMEYGEVSDTTRTAKLWLKEERNSCIHAHFDKSSTKPSSSGKKVVNCINPDELLATVFDSSVEDIDQIISDSLKNHQWFNMEAIKKATLLEKLATEISKNSSLLSQIEMLARGIKRTDTEVKAIPLLTEYLQYYSSCVVEHGKSESNKEADVTFSGISDQSFLAVFGLVLGPALAAGYNVILQTGPHISLAATLIVQLAEKVGIPVGVIKLIPGYVNLTSAFKHKEISVVSSFGTIYKHKYEKKPLGTKFLALENSKAPMIIFNNADLYSACDAIVDAVWGYQGLLPWSINTVLVQEDVFQIFVDMLKHRISKIKMGVATDKMADVSHLNCNIYCAPVDCNLQLLVKQANEQGIEVHQNKNNCATFQPTLFIGGKLLHNNVIEDDNDLPILTVLAFRNSNEGVNLANNSRFGFAASVWTENIGLANEVASKLNVSNVWINSHGHFTAATSITPRKQSGIGSFGGHKGLCEYINRDTFCQNEKYSNNAKDEREFNAYFDSLLKKTKTTVAECPEGNTMEVAIASAKSAQPKWNKMSIHARGQLLKSIANDMLDKKIHLMDLLGEFSETVLDKWIKSTYEGSSQIINMMGNVLSQNSFELKTCKEALGIIVIVVTKFYSSTIDLIIGALLAGNSVILLNWPLYHCNFFATISNLFSASKIPKGVLNLVSNCDERVLSTFFIYKELRVYFTELSTQTSESLQNIYDFKRFYNHSKLNWSDILVKTTTEKNIWSNVGDSVI